MMALEFKLDLVQHYSMFAGENHLPWLYGTAGKLAEHPSLMASPGPGTIKYLEVTDSDLSLLRVALEQVSDQNNHDQASIQPLLDRISYSLSSSPSSHPDMAHITIRVTTSCNHLNVNEDNMEMPSHHAVDTAMSLLHTHPNYMTYIASKEADIFPISASESSQLHMQGKVDQASAVKVNIPTVANILGTAMMPTPPLEMLLPTLGKSHMLRSLLSSPDPTCPRNGQHLAPSATCFVIMVAHMQLAIVCQSIIRDSNDTTSGEKTTIIKVYQKYVAKLRNPPVEHSFYRWYSTELRKTIAEVGGHIFAEVGQMLRQPETSSLILFLPGMWQLGAAALHWSRGPTSLCAEKTDRRENAAWTEGERTKAEAGYVVKDVEDLCKMMAVEKWKTIPIYKFQWMFFKGEGELELHNSDDSLMLFACSSLPDQIRQNLCSSLLACFDGNDVLVDQKLDEDFHNQDVSQPQTNPSTTTFSLEPVVESILQRPFQCLHFSLWNRYITNGDNAPTHIHPHDMARLDVSRTNYSQHLPYPSRDVLQHQQLYRNIQSSFEELFQWIEQVIKK
ncbi:hypothetical protein DFJ58DRAFT_846782 [Suillus subalutaceus]|uniref:uncharacterized protein n=1 Tax=Suillus subalutaceus TaxID=48586 RepID=UPI001B85E377|nr:uncharacterized protein DFJ58DRAFT_846782 [Suillus subalutaceus]KAG1836799.1 hypothetical protein DFJ58DRAFT_846782 [Suillus subalutaceus]